MNSSHQTGKRRPTGLYDVFARDPIAQRHWPEFLRRLRIEGAPETRARS